MHEELLALPRLRPSPGAVWLELSNKSSCSQAVSSLRATVRPLQLLLAVALGTVILHGLLCALPWLQKKRPFSKNYW